MPSSSFYVDGETYSTALVSSADQPGTLTPSQAPSSFYPDGATYEQSNPDTSGAYATQAAASAAVALASQNAASTSASSAAASAASATAHDSDALTQAQTAYTNAQSALSSAGAAATSATAASTSASNAATSATNAAGSATAASGSASAASTSATNAHTSELNAATSASNASTSATNAAASVQAVAGAATPLQDGTAAVGTSTKWAHEDHVHPTDTSRAPLASPALTGVPTAPTAPVATNTTQIATTAFVLANATGTGAVRYDIAQTFTEAQKLQVLADLGVPFHCGYLSFVSTTAIKFAPYNGDLIKINGLVYRIPSAGIAGVANTGVYVNGVAGQNLAASTVYYVYAFDNAGTLTADFSTTGHGTSGTAGNVGVEVKNGDNTRSLIGMICTTGSATFVDSGTVCGVLSWFNRRLKKYAAGGANVTTTSVSTVVMSAALVSMLNWATVPVNAILEGQSTTSGSFAQLAVGMDGTTAFGATQFTYTGGPYPACIGGWDTPTEGFHNYYIIGGATSGSGTAQINNTTIYGVTFG